MFLGTSKAKHKRNLIFDTQHTTVDKHFFAAHNWYDFYRDSKEAIPEEAPTPRGNVVSTHCFVDVDHAGDMSTRISKPGS